MLLNKNFICEDWMQSKGVVKN